MHRYIFLSILLLSGCMTRRPLSEIRMKDLVNHRLLKSLGATEIPIPTVYFDPELAGIFQEFKADARKRNIVIPAQRLTEIKRIEFVEVLSSTSEESVIASCNRFTLEEQSVVLSKLSTSWSVIEVSRPKYEGFLDGNKMRLKELLYHELYHCAFAKGHLPDGIEGIMSATFVKGDRRAMTHWNELVDDLFSKEYMDLTPETD